MKKQAAIAFLLFTAVTGVHSAAAQDWRPDGAAPVGHVGITIGCDCTVSTSPSELRPWQFRSPIRVIDVEPQGPATGRLLPEDMIVSVDGARITTPQGARRFANLQPGVKTRLEVVRDGETRTVDVTPGTIYPNDPRAIGAYAPASQQYARDRRASPAPGAPTTDPRGDSPTAAPVPLLADLLPAGRLGFALSCTGCGWERGDGDATPRWHSRTPPRVYAVEPEGPAAAAGLRAGDVLMTVDGLPITSTGGAALGEARPGEPLSLGVRRDDRSLEFSLVPDRREAEGSLRNRYDGSFGSLDVNVQSSTPAVVSVSGDGNEMTIVVNGAVVRLRVPGKG